METLAKERYSNYLDLIENTKEFEIKLIQFLQFICVQFTNDCQLNIVESLMRAGVNYVCCWNDCWNMVNVARPYIS